MFSRLPWSLEFYLNEFIAEKLLPVNFFGIEGLIELDSVRKLFLAKVDGMSVDLNSESFTLKGSF